MKTIVCPLCGEGAFGNDQAGYEALKQHAADRHTRRAMLLHIWRISPGLRLWVYSLIGVALIVFWVVAA